MAWGAVAGAAVSVVGGILGNKKSSKAQTDANALAIAEQKRQFDLTRADQLPFLQTGYKANDQISAALSGDLSGFQSSPDYQFRQQEGTRTIGNSFAARGGAFSGNALKALTQYNSNLAAGEYGDWWNRRQGVISGGQQTANNLAVTGQNNANNIAALYQNSGEARASGVAGTYNAIGGALTGLAKRWGYGN